MAGECHAALYLPVRPHRTAIWDYSAAGRLLAEAGGWFGSTDGMDLLQQRPFAHTGGWVVAPGTLHQQLLDVAQRVRNCLTSRNSVQLPAPNTLFALRFFFIRSRCWAGRRMPLQASLVWIEVSALSIGHPRDRLGRSAHLWRGTS